jgi:arylsulfatase A-like enzyme
MGRPNILLILTDEQRAAPVYESDELRQYRREACAGQERLRGNGIEFCNHYPMAAACAPSRSSLLTGHYPPLHGVTQTDGIAKSADGDEMFWLAHDSVPTMGDWFRAGDYRTFYKGKWHVSHAHLDAEDGDGYLLSVDDDGKPQPENIARYLQEDLLDAWGFSEWVGPEPHGLAPHSMGTVRDPFTADETIELLQRLDADGGDKPWLTVCSLLNPHDVAFFGLFGLAAGQRYHPRTVPKVPRAPTQGEDLSTKPRCQQSMVDLWSRMFAPQPFTQPHLKFYYEMQAAVDQQITRVLDALQETEAHENTVVVFTSDHGDMMGAHGGIHQKWHNAYEESLRVPFIVSSPLLPAGHREFDIPTSHADLIPTLLGLAGIDRDEALARLSTDHSEARPLVGRDLSAAIRSARPQSEADPVLFMTDDEISEGSEMSKKASPQGLARFARFYSTVEQPNHIETVIAELDVDGEEHLVKFSRYHDNPQFWTVPGERDERLRGRKTITVTEPEPDEYELYDLTLDPLEERNLAHPSHADESSRELQQKMFALLAEELERKRLTPKQGGTPGYRPPRRSEQTSSS